MQHIKHTLYQGWSRRIIKLYPTPWRERYAEEMLLTLEDVPPTLKTVINLLINLFDAYLHRNLVMGRTPPMLQKMRANELSIYSATLIFFVAWFFAQLNIRVPGRPRSLLSSFSYTPSSLIVNIIHLVSFALLLLILLGGLPILLAACWQALKSRKFFTLLLCLLGLISPLVMPFLALYSLSLLERSPLPPGATSTSLAFLCLLIGLSLSLALIYFAVQRVAPSRHITHYGLSLARSVPVIMGIGLATLLLGALPSFTTAFIDSSDPIYTLRQALLILIMGVALLYSFISLKRGLQAKQTAHTQL